MTRLGCRRIASMATIAFGIGSRSSGFSPNGTMAGRGGIGGGTAAEVGLISFIMVLHFLVRMEDLQNRAKDGFVKIPVKRSFSNELYRQTRRADERPENPAQLAAEKQIARQPRKEHASRCTRAAAELPQKLSQTQIAGDSGEGDHRHMHELNEAV